MKTFGAAGYTIEYGIESELRNSLAGLAYSGTPDVTKNVIASFLGVHRPS